MISFLQINVGGRRAAQGLALQTEAELGADIIVFSEIYKFGKAHEAWQCDRSMRSAIAVTSNLPVDQTDSGANDGFVWVTVGDIRIYSCYWSPNTSLAEYEDFVRRLKAIIRASPVDVVVGGDFNAKNGY